MRARVTALRPSTLGTLGLLGVTVAWGSTFFLIKDVVTRMPVADFLAVRFAVAAVALAALSPTAVFRMDPQARRRGVVLGVVYGVAQILQTTGLAHTSASVSGFITGMYVVLTPLFAGLLLRQRVGPAAWAAVALATTGLAVLSLRGVEVGLGETLTLLSAACYALHIIGLGAWSTGRDAMGLSVVQMVTIAAVCGVAAAPDGITLPPDGAAWLGVVYTALLAGALALVVQTWAQAHMSATRAAIVMTMEPVFAGAFAVLLGGESVTLRLLLGGALVLAAMYLAELGPRHGADAELPHVTAP
ncbi:MAG: DMT family transporter [Actinomycetes bacterium]